MTRLELSEILIDRVGFKPDPVYSLDSDVTKSISGRYFQKEHSFVSIENISSLMPKVYELNEYLLELKKNNAIKVVDEAFTQANLSSVDLDGQENIFDAALSKRMAIQLSELAYTTIRINRNERIAKEVVDKLFFDVNGDPNYPDKISISSSYAKELYNLKDMFNTEQMLDVVTFRTNSYLDDDNFLKYE